MKQIEDFGMYALKLSDEMDFTYTTLSYIAKDENIKEMFPEQVQNLKDAYDKMFTISQRHRGNLLTSKVQTTDTWRDSLFSMFMNIVKMEKNNPVPEKSQSAAELEFAIKSYKSVNSQSYTTQSSLLRSMCADLKNYHAAALAELGLNELLGQLESANQDFEDAINERRETLVGRENGEMQAARVENQTAYRILVLVVNAATYSPNADKVASFVGKQNVLVAEFRQKVGQSSGVPDAKPDDETTTPEQTPDLTPDETPAEGGEQKPENPDEKPGNSEGSENNPSTPGTPSNPSNPTDPDDPDALKPGPGGDDPDL